MILRNVTLSCKHKEEKESLLTENTCVVENTLEMAEYVQITQF